MNVVNCIMGNVVIPSPLNVWPSSRRIIYNSIDHIGGIKKACINFSFEYNLVWECVKD
jgi:hypothetical protein